MKAVQNKELATLFNYLSSIIGRGLTVDEIKRIRAARKIAKEKLEEYNDARKAIWDSYGIENDEQLNKHEQKEEALAKVKELDEQSVEIAGLKILPEEKCFEICPDNWNQNDIDKVIEYLAK